MTSLLFWHFSTLSTREDHYITGHYAMTHLFMQSCMGAWMNFIYIILFCYISHAHNIVSNLYYSSLGVDSGFFFGEGGLG
jgi:hypothetical protein